MLPQNPIAPKSLKVSALSGPAAFYGAAKIGKLFEYQMIYPFYSTSPVAAFHCSDL